MVAIFDLLPYGSSVGGVIVGRVALTVSIPVCLATVVFYVVFRFAEIPLDARGRWARREGAGGGHRRRRPPQCRVVGVVGALVAVSVAAALKLVGQELLLQVLDEA